MSLCIDAANASSRTKRSTVPMQKPGAAALHNLGGEQVQKMLAAKSKSSAKTEAGVYEGNVGTPDDDRVFVPHYEVYANKKQQFARPLESPPSVLPPSGSNQFWPSSGEGSSMSSVDNYDQTASVSMHQRLSEFQVALRASERAREEGQRETDSLRVYVGSVEAAAAGLLSRVQELEHLLALSSVVKHGHDIDQLRGKVATAATYEVRKHSAAAAQAVAAAREATMELDKVRRETRALTKAQQQEIERLNVEAAEARILHEARALQNQDLLDQNGKLEKRWEDMNSRLEELQATHKAEYSALQKKYETLKTTARENRTQNSELKKALEMNRLTVHSLQKKFDDMQVEQKELTLQNELLEQQVKSLQGQEISSTIAHYDHELRKVRASLGGEKAQLLVELASLRRSNHNLRAEVEDWQDKFRTLSQHYSGLEDLACHTENSSNRRTSAKPCHNMHNTSRKSDNSSRNSSRNSVVKGECKLPSPREIPGDEGRLGSDISSTASVAGPSSKSSGSSPAGEPKAEEMCPRSSISKDEGQNGSKSKQPARSPNASAGADGVFLRTSSGTSSKSEQVPQALLISKANMLR
ncbi:hypothetical protein M758_6G146300 [Ceratodon purpureus]|nr:hypothetical protein M758_6G146300 [Ceratodon purpureus]